MPKLNFGQNQKSKSEEPPNNLGGEMITDVWLDKRAHEDYLAYMVIVNEERAFGGAFDGLKPVARRILWTMWNDLHLYHNAKLVKSARVVGSTMGLYHPHGDCLDGETQVYLLSGKTVLIKDLVGKGAQWVLSYDSSTQQIIPALAHSWRVGQFTQKTYKLHLSDGSCLEVTGNHQFKIRNKGWVKTKKLRSGQVLMGAAISTHDYPLLTANWPRVTKPLHKVVSDYFNGPLEEGYVRHHKNENTKDNRPSNLEVITRGEHAGGHEDYKEGLAVGRKAMFDKRGKFRKAIRKKNSRLIALHNEWLWLIKAIKIVNAICDDGLKVDNDTYNQYRKTIYDGTTIAKLLEKGFSPEKVFKVKDTWSIDTSSACGLTLELHDVVDEKQHKNRNTSIEISANLGMGRVAKVIRRMLRREKVTSMTWDNYEKHRKIVCKQDGSGYANIGNRSFLKRETICARLAPDTGKLTFDQLIEKIGSNNLLFIERIETVRHTESKPMYDFTVDNHANMFIKTKQTEEGVQNLVCTHNSSLYGSVITMVNSAIPMIEGQGNFGTLDDDAAAQRYTEVRLSRFSNEVFFNRFYTPLLQMVPTYDDTRLEPVEFMSLLPNFLINGMSGIGVGFATKSPSYTTDSVIKLIKKVLDTKDNCTHKQCFKYLKFNVPLGGEVVLDGDEAVEQLTKFYKTGKGRLRFNATGDYDKEGNFVIRGFGPISSLENRISNAQYLDGVASVTDISDVDTDETYTVLVTFKRGLEKVAKVRLTETLLQTTFGCAESYDFKLTRRTKRGDIQISRLRAMTVPTLIDIWIKFRLQLERDACAYWIIETGKEIAHLRLLMLAISHLDTVVKALKMKKPDAEVIAWLAAQLKITTEQANSIFDMKVRSLRALEMDKLKKEEAGKLTYVKELTDRKKRPEHYLPGQLDALLAKLS